MDVVRELEEGEDGYSPELWKKMAGLGWMGLNIPEDYDGMGMDFLDLIVDSKTPGIRVGVVPTTGLEK